MQRSYIIALLQGLATTNDVNSPRLVLGCEEPELYQHPPQARHLSTVLQKLSDKNSQVIISSHSPYFVDGAGFDRVRVVRKLREEGRAVVRACTIAHLGSEYARVTGEAQATHDGVLAKLHQIMQPHLSEMFFTSKLILVEGLEDAAYINAWLLLSDQWEGFRSRSAHIVAVNGKSELIRPTIIAAKMQIPTYVIFDCDGDKLTHTNTDRAKSIRTAHERDNKALFALVGATVADVFPNDPVWGPSFAAWPSDLGSVVKAEAAGHWDPAGAVASVACGGAGGVQKNTLHIGARLKELKRLGASTPTLDKLCRSIVSFAAQP